MTENGKWTVGDYLFLVFLAIVMIGFPCLIAKDMQKERQAKEMRNNDIRSAGAVAQAEENSKLSEIEKDIFNYNIKREVERREGSLADSIREVAEAIRETND